MLCKKLYLGHNRLSIIDLSNNASQPFVSVDQNYIITFNGEIYNAKYLKTFINQKNLKLLMTLSQQLYLRLPLF